MEKKIDLLKQILRLPQEQLHNTLYKFLKKYYKNVKKDENFLIAEGDIPVALVAHMDTVHKQLPKDIFYDTKETVMWSPQGLGADDRAGIFAIIDIIQRGFRPHIIFTKDEEQGGIGASVLISKMPTYPFERLNFIIELDRANKEDCVFYECGNDEFEKYIQSFGFKTELGSFTDISIIAPKWKVAAVNLSVGYYNEHRLIEHLYLSQLNETIEKVINILQDENMLAYEYIETCYYNERECQCFLCQTTIKPYQGVVTYQWNMLCNFCLDCYSNLNF